MQTLIVGAGIIGVIYGWALSEAGVEVTHYVRPGKAQAFEGGVTLDLLDERKGHAKYNHPRYALRCVEAVAPTDGYELVIVPTGAHQTEAALTQLAPVCGEATFLILAANWDGTDFIDRLLPRRQYLLGYPDGGGTRRQDVYWTNLGAELSMGMVDAQAAPRLEQVRALLARADIKADVQANMAHWLWVHNAGTVGFQAGFAKRPELQAYLKDTALLRQCVLATRELYQLCSVRGVDLKQYPETGFINLPVWLAVLLLRWNFRRNESMQRYTAHAAESLEEARVNYAGMLRTAEEHKLAMPNMRALGAYLEQSVAQRNSPPVYA